MNATTLYVSTCRYILQAEHNDPNTWSDLYRRLPYLRQSLSCCVCAGLLHDPMGPSNSTCQHFVCRGCLGGKMLLKPSCSWCKDYSVFAEVKQLQILLSCYKKLCEYIADTPIARNLVGANGGSSISHSSGLSILQEGMAINDSHYERSRSQDISGFNLVEYLAKASMNASSGHAGSNSVQNGHGSEAATPHHSHPEVGRESQGALNHTKALNGSEAEPYVSVDGGLDEYSVTISPNSDNSASPKIKIKRNKRLEMGHHSQPKSNLHLGLSIAKVKRKYQRRSKSRLLAANGLVDLHSLSNTPRKLVISGHRAKLLKAGRTLEIKEGCRCGTGSKYPGLNTCQGHRCPCFVSEVPCTKCRCKGCRNPLKSSEVGD